ncbi:acyltransferase family protein [Paenibacillus sp. BK720]|uniref:acyltransferase family protein n=1 Tax=Paenibacillus sp. BK720 TaxID=2587092 RepID=UPI0014224ECC|nr:acyltransferase family protein [Paenibacillus sp. BK720]NIK69243.1 fucose 4-O-acetylase-like acetyltransferase [Paenibacillus sp. BK720]
MSEKERNIGLDIVKGIGIIAVVVGHSTGGTMFQSILYWFHMPLFFFISGFLFRPLQNLAEYKKWAVNRVKQLIVPYISFVLIITFVRYLIIGPKTIKWYFSDVLHILAGGQSIPDAVYVTIWFITCLIFTQLLFGFMQSIVKNKIYLFVIVIILYLLAHAESRFMRDLHIPGNIDVSLLAVTYFYCGFVFSHLLIRINKDFMRLITILSCTFVILLITLKLNGMIDYSLDMYKKNYNNLILDIVVPVIFILFIYTLSNFISHIRAKVIGFILSLGRDSLVIMYLHIAIKLLIEGVMENQSIYTEILAIILGILVPWLIAQLLLTRFYPLRKFFLGTTKRVTG